MTILGGAGLQDTLDLAFGQRKRLLGIGADKAGHPRRIAHDIPRLIVHAHLDEDIPRKDLALHDLLAPALHLDIVIHRNDDIENRVLKPHGTNLALKIRLHLVLVSGIGMDDIPFLLFFCFHRCLSALPQNKREQSGKKRIADPNKRADDDDRNTDNGRVRQELAPRRPRYLFHLGLDLAEKLHEIEPRPRRRRRCLF